MTINKTGDWRNDFDWTDLNDVQLNVVKENGMIEDGELGPENKEAGELMNALSQSIKLKNPKHYDVTIPPWERNEEISSSGVGKDVFGKYAFEDVEHEGKTYVIQMREKSKYDDVAKIIQGRMIGPKLIPNKKELN